jgi:hypothetical protein
MEAPQLYTDSEEFKGRLFSYFEDKGGKGETSNGFQRYLKNHYKEAKKSKRHYMGSK